VIAFGASFEAASAFSVSSLDPEIGAPGLRFRVRGLAFAIQGPGMGV